jgi:hypothetical protein
MATFYKYAERSADSQVNWAEIGKNMTDMLKQEVNVREEKKAAIDEATRRYAEELSNAPQGEHVGAREEALRFADDASQYMLMQERLLKSGLLKPRDYMVARQNIVDGTKKAFSSMKAFQSQYAELMERAKTDKSSALEIQNLEEIQGYGNFRESGFFIDSPTGKVNVGLKDYQDIDGKKVVALKQGSTRGMQYIDGGIYGRIDKFKPLEALSPIAETLGLEIQSTLDPSTITKLGSITSVEDLRNRKDIDPVTGQILFDFYSSIKDSVNAVMANPLQKASLLADTLGYLSTTDPEAAAKDPKLILKVIDPNSGRGEYQFSAEQDKVAEKWMTQQLLSMVTRKEDVKTTPQTSQLREPSEAGIAEQKAISDAKNIAENLVFALTGDANKSNSGTKFISGLTGIDFNKTKNGFSIVDENGNLQEFKFRADGKTLADPISFVKSFVGPLARVYDVNQDVLIKEFQKFLPKGATLNETTEARGFDEQAMGASAFESLTKTVDANMDEPQVATNIQSYKKATDMAEYLNSNVAPNLGLDVSFSNGLLSYGQSIYVEVGGKSSPNYSIGSPEKNKLAMRKMKDFLIDNLAAGATPEERDIAAEDALRNMQLPKGAATTETSETSAAGTSNLNASQRKGG